MLYLHYSDNSVITRADGNRGGRVFTLICLFVCPHDISKVAAARIIKLDPEIFHNDSMTPGNPFLSGSKGQRSRSLGTKTVPAWVFAFF